MKQLTKYQANDGTLFDSLADAVLRDRLMSRCATIARHLPEPPRDSHERVEHNVAQLSAYRREVVELCRELYPGESVFEHAPEEIHPMSYAGRFLSEAAPRCVNDLWWRLSCCNGVFEYEQPYFAMNPGMWKPRETANALGDWAELDT